MMPKLKGKLTKLGMTKLPWILKYPEKTFTRPVKNTAKMLILVSFTVRLSVSPVNPEANSFTTGWVKARTKTTIIAAIKTRALLRLQVYLSASSFPRSPTIRLYMGTKPVAIPELTNEKMTAGIVCAMR
jgi:hypothetical protein